MWKLQVGEPFSPERRQWEADRFEYRYFGGTHLLQLCVDSPSLSELAAFRFGRVFIGLLPWKSSLFFVFKIEGLYRWSDQAFSIHLAAPIDREIPAIAEKDQSVLYLVLVNAKSGIVEGIRAVTYSCQFTSVLHQHLNDQLLIPFDPEAHDQNIREVYSRYPSSRDIAMAAQMIECAGRKS